MERWNKLQLLASYRNARAKDLLAEKGGKVEDAIERWPILELTKESRHETEAMVVKESQLTIIFNSQELVTLSCSPVDFKYLAIGFLFSEGLLSGKDEIKTIIVDAQRGVARVETREDKDLPSDFLFKRVITSGCGKGASFSSMADTQGLVKVESQNTISVHEVFALANKFQHCSQVYRTTHGTHSAALCSTKEILLFSDDIGRHNAIDKIFGECLLKEMETDNRIAITSGRLSSDMLLKLAKRTIPIAISISAPTNSGVQLASDFGITLIGLVRGRKMNVYANGWRVTT